MITASSKLFILRELPFSSFNFPRWQSVLAITLVGALTGLDPSVWSDPSLPVMALWLKLGLMVACVWLAFFVVVVLLRWWLQRNNRWDKHGNLFNLVAASWLIPDALSAALTALGVPALLSLPLGLYSIWVGANALTGAVPKASLGYSICGVVISMVLAIFAAGVLFAVLTMLAFGPMPAQAG